MEICDRTRADAHIPFCLRGNQSNVKLLRPARRGAIPIKTRFNARKTDRVEPIWSELKCDNLMLSSTAAL